jgi:multiple sugar transport system substrate-binding protein
MRAIMKKNIQEIGSILDQYDAGTMNHRSLLQQLSALGVSVVVANAIPRSPLGAKKAFAAISGPEERAWALAKEAAAKATKKTPTILIPAGSIGNKTPYVDKWKNELGIQLIVIEEPDEVVHTKSAQEAVAKTSSFDVMMLTVSP